MILYKTNTVSLSYHVCSVLCDALTDANDGQLWMMMNDWCPWCSNIFIALNRFHLQSSSFITLKKIVAQLIFRARFMPSQSMNKKKISPSTQYCSGSVLFCIWCISKWCLDYKTTPNPHKVQKTIPGSKRRKFLKMMQKTMMTKLPALLCL